MQTINNRILRCELGRNAALESFHNNPSVEFAAIYCRWCNVLETLERRAERIRNEQKNR